MNGNFGYNFNYKMGNTLTVGLDRPTQRHDTASVVASVS